MRCILQLDYDWLLGLVSVIRDNGSIPFNTVSLGNSLNNQTDFNCFEISKPNWTDTLRKPNRTNFSSQLFDWLSFSGLYLTGLTSVNASQKVLQFKITGKIEKRRGKKTKRYVLRVEY